MPFNGAGVFTPLTPEYPAVSGEVIFADDWNAILEDLSAGLSIAMTTDGQSTPTADLTMGGFKLTNLGAGVLANDAVRYVQVFTSPAFTTPTIVTNPATTNDSQLIVSSSWVQDRLAEEIDYGFDPASGNYGRDLVTSKWVKDQLVGPPAIPSIAIFAFQNL